MSIIDNVFGMEIERVGNGYIVHTFEGEDGDVGFEGKDEDVGPTTSVIRDDENDELKSTEELLWEVIEYFGKQGSRYDAERLRINREPGDKYIAPPKQAKKG